MEDCPKEKSIDKKIEKARNQRKAEIKRLSDFTSSYDADLFLSDLESYFEGEVDFNLDKIKEVVKKPENLEQLVFKARQQKTHPVIEFVREILRDL